MAEQENGSSRVIASIGAIAAIVGGVSAVFLPMQHRLDQAVSEMKELQKIVRLHESQPAHQSAAEILKYQKERLDRDFKTISDAASELDHKLQLEMKSYNSVTDEKIIALDKAIQREMRNLDDVQAAQLSFLKEMMTNIHRRVDILERRDFHRAE